jgi:hypothetical protein
VFVATHKESGEAVAVKHIKKYEDLQEDFTWLQEQKLLVREVETLARVVGCSKGFFLFFCVSHCYFSR